MNYDLSVIVPVYNEQQTVLKLLDKLTAAPALAALDLQVIVVDDGSTDRTASLLQSSRFAKDPRFVWLRHQKNQGKGAAIRTALAQVQGHYTVIQDADLEYDPNDIAKLLSYARQKNLPVVYGSRNLDPQTPRGGFWFYWGGRLLTAMANFWYGQKITDEPTCYKLFLTSFLKSLPLTCTGFEFCPEVTALTARRGVHIPELAISYYPRSPAEGKKINWTDGLVAVWTLLRLRVDTKKTWLMAAALGVFVGLWYLVTWQHLFMGYERETAQSAVDMLSGTYQVFRAGTGAVLMYLPFVALGRLLYPSDLMNFLTLVPIFYSGLTAVVFYLLVWRLSSRKSAATLVAALVATASLMWPYSRIGMEYQAMFALTWLLLALVSWRKLLRAPVFVGAALALAVFVKSYGVIFVLPAFLFVGSELRQKRQLRRLFNPGFLAAFFLPTILVLAASVGLNTIVLGKASGAYALAHEFQIRSWWEGFFGTFFSAGKSILLYSPLLIVSLGYWKKFWQRDRSTAAFVIVSFLLLLLLTAPFSFWSDETLSVRKLMPVVPLLHLPLLYAFEAPVWSKIKKISFVFVTIVALYFQLLNSLYPYWYQLVLFRPYNQDNLTTLRYNPRLSALALNQSLFLSYLHRLTIGYSQNFVYQERTWMRCCTGEPQPDPFFVRMNFSLAGFDRPEIYLVKGENPALKKTLATAESAGLVISGGFLVANLINRRREENLSLPSVVEKTA